MVTTARGVDRPPGPTSLPWWEHLALPVTAYAVRLGRAALVGSLMPHSRLDPPMLLALDEVTQICPVPLPLWMADSAGKGILIVAVCHGLAQLEARWDSAGARAIWDTAGIKVILGGVTDPDTLDRGLTCGYIGGRSRVRTWVGLSRRFYRPPAMTL